LQISMGEGGRAVRVKLELDPDVDDEAPDGPDITVYDDYLNSQTFSFCMHGAKPPGFTGVLALAGDETDFVTDDQGGHDDDTS
jgi:hypothetical protein